MNLGDNIICAQKQQLCRSSSIKVTKIKIKPTFEIIISCNVDWLYINNIFSKTKNIHGRASSGL